MGKSIWTIKDLKKNLPADKFKQICDKNNLTESNLPKKKKFNNSPIKAENNQYGINFQSTTEYIFYDLLSKRKIKFIFQPELIVKQKQEGIKRHSQIKYTADFYLPDYKYYIELKGDAKKTLTDASRLRMLLALEYLAKNEPETELLIISKKECQNFVLLLSSQPATFFTKFYFRNGHLKTKK